MRKFLLLALLVSAAVTYAALPPDLVYNGDTLEWNYAWKRSKCGTLSESLDLPEVSGIACSRVTPGYIWMESDDYESYIIATTEKGQDRACKLKMSRTIGWDWEDMSGGVYEGKNYLFIGSFGDNEETRKDYRIVWFEEPAIDPVNKPEQTVTPNYIRYKYPDGKSHNNEALMYDNREQMIYIITKVYYNVCQVFKLPFRLDYSTSDTLTLEYVCDLGVRSDLGESDKDQPYMGFHLVTGADISPDGKYILIKNHNNIVAKYSWILYWTRLDGESVADAIQNRAPQPLRCYSYEWQGEAICWLDDDTFYTTSDSDGEPPIYKYTRKWGEGVENVQATNDNRLVMKDGAIYLRTPNGFYTLDGRKVQ